MGYHLGHNYSNGREMGYHWTIDKILILVTNPSAVGIKGGKWVTTGPSSGFWHEVPTNLSAGIICRDNHANFSFYYAILICSIILAQLSPTMPKLCSPVSPEEDIYSILFFMHYFGDTRGHISD